MIATIHNPMLSGLNQRTLYRLQNFKDICYLLLVQYVAYSLFYAWAIHLSTKKDMSLVSVFFSSVSLSLSHWYPGSGVVLDCIDS